MSTKYEQFGKFILLDKVAAGGMAEVYRAKAPGAEGIGKILAIKRILPQYNANVEFIEMFKTEALIAINLTQGNIAQIYEFGEEKHLFFLLMEYIDGRNLRQVLSRCAKAQKALTIEQCVYIISQVANGLDYAHRCIDKNTGGPLNIIHRDMSPQNIMISFEGEVKIIDFGIAKAETKIETTRAGTLKGKFGYMSPEQAEGFDLDARTDIFSAGIVLWELLSGERLFIANNEVNTIRKIKECQIPSLRKINPNIHEELERIVMKTLAKDRNLRYQNSNELNRDLSRFLYKVNPEFTPHDLAITIKTLFKDDILEDRRKSQEYAKLTIPNPKEEKTAVMSEPTRTVTESDDPTATTRGNGKDEPHRALVIDSKKVVENIDFSNLEAPELIKNFFKNRHLAANQLTKKTSTQSKAYSAPGFRYKKSGDRLAKWGPRFLVFVGVGAGLFLLAANPAATKAVTYKVIGSAFTAGASLVDSAEKAMGITEPERAPSTTPFGQETLALQAPMERVYINSRPAGAQIEIDGSFMGTTPMEVQVPVNRNKVNITLRREGYFTYYKEYVAVTDKPTEITATLQKAIVGYVNIEVEPSFADIYINGQKLSEKAPIKRYAVPADKPISIYAVNPYTNTRDDRTVVVKHDTVQDIKLFLRRSN